MTTSDTGSDTAVVAIDPLVFERRWKILAVLCTSLMVVIVGNTALNVALPTLARELRASTSAQQWMVDGYGLVFAGLLLTAGTIGDRYGRKGALQIGLLIFLAGSLLGAFMDSAGGVIAGRAVMGFGAAFVMPATLSILTNVFPPHERGKAIAIWAGISGGGAAIGPVASGFLLAHFSWGSVFLVNVPIIVGRPRRRQGAAPDVARPRARTRSTRSARCCRSPGSARSSTPSSRRRTGAGPAPRASPGSPPRSC